MSMYTLLRNHPIPTEEMIERALQGNLCRCTGYRPIIQGFKLFTSESAEGAISNTGCPMGEACCKNQKGACSSGEPPVTTDSKYIPDHSTQEPIFPPELKSSEPDTALKITGPRAIWYRPTALADLMKIRLENPSSKIITGNTECGVETKFRGWLYPHLISPVAVPELNEIKICANSITIGASTTLNEIDRVFQDWINCENNSPKTQIASSV